MPTQRKYVYGMKLINSLKNLFTILLFTLEIVIVRIVDGLIIEN
jgi:hypothetical protein